MKKKTAKSSRKVTKRPSNSAQSVVQMTERGRKIKKYTSMYEAYQATGVDSGSISKVVRGIREYAGGFRWQLA